MNTSKVERVPLADKTSKSSVLKGNTFFLVLAGIAILIIGAIVTDSFVDAFNLSRLMRQMGIMGLMAVGMTYVIIGGNGGIDLSIGSTFGIAAMISISMQYTEVQNTGGAPYPGVEAPVILILLTCAAAGVIMGLINGLGVAQLKLSPFIMTLAMLNIGRGIVLVYSNGFQFVGVREDFKNVASGFIGDILPYTIIIFAAVVVVSYFVLHRSAYGRKLFAVGANINAASISGGKTKKLEISTYIISGVCAAVAGMLFTSFTMSADPYAGNGYELDAISAVLIGGTPMAGGQGTVIGTVMGLLFITLIKNLLTQLNINSYIQQVITALLIMVVVLIQQRQLANMEKRV